MYKIDAAEKLELLTISAYPHMEKSSAKSVVTGYRYATGDIIDQLLKDNDHMDHVDKIKGSL